jgi:C_GCAxxG_C_C family probable redox protein
VLAAIQDALGGIGDEVFKAGHALAGGGALTTRGTCGALSGGLMAISCQHGRDRANFVKGRNRRCNALGKRLFDRFVEEYGSPVCRDVQTRLMGRSFDMWDPNDYKAFEQAGGHMEKCPTVTGNTARWVAEILLEEKGE